MAWRSSQWTSSGWQELVTRLEEWPWRWRSRSKVKGCLWVLKHSGRGGWRGHSFVTQRAQGRGKELFLPSSRRKQLCRTGQRAIRYGNVLLKYLRTFPLPLSFRQASISQEVLNWFKVPQGKVLGFQLENLPQLWSLHCHERRWAGLQEQNEMKGSQQ